MTTTAKKSTRKSTRKSPVKKASKKASKRTVKKAAPVKKASKKTVTKADDIDVPAKKVRTGLTDVPNALTGKAIRRILRAAGIRLSEMPELGKVPVTVKDGFAIVKIGGQEFKTAVRPDADKKEG